MNIAIVPARSGSKRIPNKNTHPFLGEPLLGRTIKLLQRSGCFEKIVVSTDSEDIQELALDYGAEAPFRRPHRLADDFAGTLPVVQHALKWLLSAGFNPAAICCVYPTAVFTTENDLARGLDQTSHAGGFVVPLTTFDYPIQRAIKIDEFNSAKMVDPDLAKERTQDLQTFYHDAGQFYWATSKTWMEATGILNSNCTALLMDRDAVIDIDTPADFHLAELMVNSDPAVICE
jgi:pseudaminic acid cytidylyltransferase